MGVGVAMMKTVLFIFNIFLTLTGIGIIIAGALILTEMADFNRIAESDLVKLAIAMIVGGAIVTIVAFVGCLGAMRESYMLLMAFAGLLLAIFIMELTVGICAAVFKTDYKVAFKESLSESLRHVLTNSRDRNYYDVSSRQGSGGTGTNQYSYDVLEGRDKNYWDVLQREFKCCGVDGPKDWPDEQRPISCCLDKYCFGNTAVYHQVGCYDTLVEKIQTSTTVLVYVGIGIAFVEISGLGIIVAGGLVLTDVSDFNHFTDSDLLGPPIVLIVAGSIVFIIAFLGCFGAIRESYNMLLAFAGLLVVIFILELAVGIAAAVYKGDFQGTLKKALHASMTNYTDNNVEKVAWDNLQKKFKCCGIEQPSDWQIAPAPWPRSCCYEDNDIEQSGNPDNETPKNDKYCQDSAYGTYVYSKGCFQKLKDKIEGNTKVLIGVGIGIAFIEVIGIFLACWLAYTIKKENETTK